MNRLVVVAIALFVSWSPLPALAQTEEHPDAFPAARELLQATGFEAQFAETIARTSETAFDAIAQQFERDHGVAMPADLARDLRRIMLEHNQSLAERMAPTVIDDTAHVYARYFTAAELRELQRLQTHPIMQRFQQVGPQLVAELSQVGFAEAARSAPELQQRVAEALQDWIARNADAPTS